MRERLRSFSKSEFFVSSFYSGLATFIRIGTAFLMSKILAIYLGPSGMGLIGQLSNFVTVILALAGGLINNGVVKYVAEYNVSDPEKIPKLISSTFKFVLVCGAMVAAALFIFSRFFSQQVFLTEDYSFVFLIFGLSVIFYGLNSFLLAVVNGFKEYRRFNYINILSSLTSLFISFLLIQAFYVKGALIALVVNQSICILITLIFIKEKEWFSKKNFLEPVELHVIKNLSGFILMTVISTAVVPVSQILVRSYIIKHFSLRDSGLWEAVNRISVTYLAFFVTTLTTYYLPKLSETKQHEKLRAEIFKIYKLVLPAVALTSLCIYLFRHFIISLLFTSEFHEADKLFLFQSLGDFLKIASWILAFQMVAKAMTRMFIITEIVFSFSFVLFSISGLSIFGLVGVSYAYALNYLLYLITLIILFRSLLFQKNGKEH